VMKIQSFWGNQCSFMNIFVWKASRADPHVLSHSGVDCRPSILTGACVNAVHVCNSITGLLFANFTSLFASLTFYTFIHQKWYVALYPMFLSQCASFPVWLLFSSCIPLSVIVALSRLLFCTVFFVPPASCHVQFLTPILMFQLGFQNSSVL
jgi:hypothetical protein